MNRENYDYGFDVRERQPLLGFALSILTFGVYSLYWTYHLHRDIYLVCTSLPDGAHRRPSKDPQPKPGPSQLTVVVLGIVTLGIYLVYWSWQQGVRFRWEARQRGSLEADQCPALYLILQIMIYFVGVTWPLDLALMQDRLNQVLRRRGMGTRSFDPKRFNHTREEDIAIRAKARAAAYEAEMAEDEELQNGIEGKRALYLNDPDADADSPSDDLDSE